MKDKMSSGKPLGRPRQFHSRRCWFSDGDNSVFMGLSSPLQGTEHKDTRMFPSVPGVGESHILSEPLTPSLSLGDMEG